MKKTFILLSLLLAAMTAHADIKESLMTLIRNHAKTSQTASAKRSEPLKLSQSKQDSIVKSITNLYSSGKISADSVVSLALYHKAASPEVAEKCLRAVAAENNLRGITELGVIYALTPQFQSKTSDGLKLLQAAANAGYNDANAYLGLYYYNRNDFKKAKAYFDRCNPMKFGFGNTALGGMYLQGKGVKTDIPKARDYFHKAALQGYARGASLYGHNLRANGGGEIDYPEAFFWLYIAGDLGDDTARATLGRPLNGESFGEGEAAEDGQVALHWISTVNSMQDMKNEPVYKDGFLKGLKGKEAAAEKGDDWARFYLGSMNYSGDFLNQNYAQAIRYYEPIAANAKLPDTVLALVNLRLANMYQTGKGTKANATKANHYAKAAAKYGSVEGYRSTEHVN
ncbi:MAG: sel1 repeat family protein [Muribaculaceae bacterium]|nr:sel1 repeat family protein [Muribaculaceae bacterium]